MSRKFTLLLQRCASVVFVVALIVPGLVLGAQEVDSANNESLESWIAQLADPNPAIRKTAETRILEHGEEALPAVKAGMRDSSLDIHHRCRILLEKIESARREELSEIFLNAEDDDVRLETYRAWPKFAKFVGSKRVLSRKLFLKMCNELPLLFEAYDFKSVQTAPELKQAARLVLVPDKHAGATPDVLAIAYLFLAEQARLNSKSEKPLFNNVEVLEAANFISNAENARRIRESDFRKVVDRCVAKWIAQKGNAQIPENTKLNLIYQTANVHLIDGMERKYDSLNLQGKLGFVDIVYRSSIGKNGSGIDQCEAWLQRPLSDEASAVKTRFRKRPAETVEVSVKNLAEAVFAAMINKEFESEEPIELTKIFGIYPHSERGFLIVESEKGRELLAERLRVRLEQAEKVR